MPFSRSLDIKFVLDRISISFDKPAECYDADPYSYPSASIRSGCIYAADPEAICEDEFDRVCRAFGISGVVPAAGCVRLHTPNHT